MNKEYYKYLRKIDIETLKASVTAGLPMLPQTIATTYDMTHTDMLDMIKKVIAIKERPELPLTVMLGKKLVETIQKLAKTRKITIKRQVTILLRKALKP